MLDTRILEYETYRQSLRIAGLSDEQIAEIEQSALAAGLSRLDMLEAAANLIQMEKLSAELEAVMKNLEAPIES